LGRKLTLWLPPLAVMLAIYLASSVPAEDLGELPSDKLLHFLAYAVLALLLARALAWGLFQVDQAAAFQALVVAALYAASDEFHQHFVPGRQPSGWDLAADLLGALAAVTVLWLLRRRQADPA
jgi:VanZ family protein